MLKSLAVTLAGADAGTTITLTELPALTADRAARTALAAAGVDSGAGLVSLALEHLVTIRRHGPTALALLQAFVSPATPEDAQALTRLKDWRSIRQLQDSALLLHVGFLGARQPLDIPVSVQAAMILRGGGDLVPSFCSTQIAAVLLSGKASYRELETVLSLEDVYNIVELLNIEALRHAAAQATHATGKARRA